jgi:hypothetical protein
MVYIYDKIYQMADAGRGSWVTAHWPIVPQSDVWRIEYRHYHQWLSKRGVNTVQDLQNHAALLWDVDTERYLSLRTSDQTIDAPYESVWEVVRSAGSLFQIPGGRIAFREVLQNPADYSTMIGSIYGYLTTLAAVNGISEYEPAIAFVLGELDRYHSPERFAKAKTRKSERMKPVAERNGRSSVTWLERAKQEESAA